MTRKDLQARMTRRGLQEEEGWLPAHDGAGEKRREAGRLGGVLFLAGAAMALPSLLVLDPLPAAWVFGVVAAALIAGLACLRVHWSALPPAALHAIPLAGTAAITAVMAGTHGQGDLFAWLYVLVIVLVAYSFSDRIVMGAYVVLVSIACAAPLADSSVSNADTVRSLLLCVPSLTVAACVVTYLRERLEAGRDAYARLARLDPLTGVGNYRTLQERLDYEIARHERHDRSFAVLLLDLDGFKDVNDCNGHLEGDRLLREVGHALVETARDEDTVARQGGDEFSVLAPETTPWEVETFAGRLQRAVAAVDSGRQVVTATMGWAVYPHDGETAQELIACADATLRAAKQLVSRPRAATAPVWSPSLRALPEPGAGAAPRANAS